MKMLRTTILQAHPATRLTAGPALAADFSGE